MDMDISMDIHAKSVDMDMDIDGKFHIHGNPDFSQLIQPALHVQPPCDHVTPRCCLACSDCLKNAN